MGLAALFLAVFSMTMIPGFSGENGADMRLRVHPDLLAYYDSAPAMDFKLEDIAAIREAMSGLIGSPDLPKDAEVNVYDIRIENETGPEGLRLRIYDPVSKPDLLPAILWMHAGGYVVGLPEQDEAQSIRLAKEVGAVVVAVDYRLAPENPYPAAIEDCYVALQWLAKNAAELGVDPERIATAGASAGGGMATALAMMTRDRKGPAIAFQMLIYPLLDDRMTTPAYSEEFDKRFWNPDANRDAWRLLLKDVDRYDVPVYLAPARETNLAGLPPAYLCVGELDPFRDDVLDYAARLARAKVPVELHLYPGAFHLFDMVAAETALGKRAVDEYVRALSEALAKKGK